MARQHRLPTRLTIGLAASLGMLCSSGAEPAPPAGDADDANYIRFVETDEGAELQTASVSYSHPDGTTVDLIGVVHIGDQSYYEDFNTQFEAYDALLYEMVGGDPDHPPTKEDLQKNKKNPLRFFQLLIAKMMDLSFQLDHIDYTADNFVHADMDFETFRRRQAEKGENILSLMEKSLAAQEAAAAEGKKVFDIGEMLKLLNQTPGPEGTKLALGRQFQNIESVIAGMEGPDGSVLVAERNIAALVVLERERKAGRKNFGVFYGAAHLPDFDKRLREKLGFKRGEVRWNTAWDVDKGGAADEPADEEGPPAAEEQKKAA